MENITHDGLVRYLCMVRVSIINGISFPFANIYREWFPSVRNIWVKRLTVVLKKVTNERIGAGCVIWRIGKRQDVLIIAFRESFNLTELRIPKFLSQDF